MSDINIDKILQLVQREGRSWEKIGQILDEHPEKIRSTFRRWRRKQKEKAEVYEEEIDMDDVYPDDPDISVHEETNELVITAKSTVIDSVEKLLKTCAVDKTVWQVVDPKLRAWTVTLKLRAEIVQKTNYYVAVRLRRREPVAVIPTIQPLKIPASRINVGGARAIRDIKIALVGSDAHFGFFIGDDNRPVPLHDEAALHIFLQVASDLQPDQIILNGDWLDLPGFSKFPQSPIHARTTQSSLTALGWYLLQLRKLCPTSAIHYLSGNHESRMHKAVMQNLRVAYELKSIDSLDGHPVMSVPYLLALDKMDINYMGNYPDDQVWLTNNLYIEHGYKVVSKGGRTASAIVNSSVHSVIFGHAHRWEHAPRTIYDRYGSYNITATCPGCLCHVDGRVPAHRQKVNWQQGFAVVYYTDNTNVEPEILSVRVGDGRAVLSGGLYTGDDTFFSEHINEEIIRHFTQDP